MTKAVDDRDLFSAYFTKLAKERQRERDNWRLYDGTEYGQWDERAIRQAAQEFRPLSTFNLAKKYIDVTVGAVIQDSFELRYDTELGDDVLPAMVLNTIYLEDKDLCGYNDHYWDFVRAGFIYRGALQMFKDFRTSHLPRVGIRYWHGDNLMIDPDWRTNDINDAENIITWTWMNPRKIMDTYDKNSVELRAAYEIWKQYNNKGGASLDHQASADSQVFDNSVQFYDSKNGMFLVMDKYYLKKVTYVDVYDVEDATVITSTDKEQARILKKIYASNGRQIKLVDRSFYECWVRTTCPGLSLEMVLQEGKYEYQFNGYPFLFFSSDRINGRPNTWIDILKDPQVQFNKRMNTIMHILMTTANNFKLIEEDAFDSSDQAQDFVEKSNRPGGGFIVRPGSNKDNKIKYLEHGDPPNDFQNSATQVWNFMRELTPSVPTLTGMGERDESGVLFQAKLQQAQTALQLPSRYLKLFWENFGDMYFEAFKQTYTYPMKIILNKSSEKVFLNVPGGIDVRTISRLKVNVSQSPTSETYRRILLQSYLTIMPQIKDDYTMKEINRLILGALPNISEPELEKLKASAQLSSEVTKKQLLLASLQMDQQIQQLTNPQPQMPGMMPGAPAPGGAPVPELPGQTSNSAPAPNPGKVMSGLQGGGMA